MFIVCDIGGTKTRIAASRHLELLDESRIIDTPKTYAESTRTIIDRIRELSRGADIEGIALGIAGMIAPDGSVVSSKHLRDWQGHNLGAELGRELDAPFITENDTAMVGLGEALHGAGRDQRIVAYITVSTGVNGARIVDGVIDRGALNFEIGGQYLSMEPPRTFEELVSGTAIRERFGMHPRELGKDHAVWSELARYVAFAVNNTTGYWSPEVIVLGGSMFNDIGISVEEVGRLVPSLLKKYPAAPLIRHASLGDVGGLWGGLARLKQLR